MICLWSSNQKYVMQPPTSSHIVYLDPKGKLIDRVNISGLNSTNISLRDDTINCTDSVTNTIYCTLNVERKEMLNHSHCIPVAHYGQCWCVMNTVYPIHHFWLRFVCSFYLQVKVQQRCLFHNQPHRRSYFYHSSNAATYIKSHCIFRS
jgi:hypothetical protein